VERGRGKRAVQAYKICPFQQVAQRHGFHAVLQQEVGRDFNNIVTKKLHSKSAGTAQHCLAHIANANHAQCLFTKRVSRNFFPFSGFHRAVHRAKAAREAEHVAEHALCDGHSKGVGRVADGNAKFSRGFLVDGINASAPLGNDFQARLASLDDTARVTVVAADSAVKLPGIRQEFFF